MTDLVQKEEFIISHILTKSQLAVGMLLIKVARIIGGLMMKIILLQYIQKMKEKTLLLML